MPRTRPSGCCRHCRAQPADAVRRCDRGSYRRGAQSQATAGDPALCHGGELGRALRARAFRTGLGVACSNGHRHGHGLGDRVGGTSAHDRRSRRDRSGRCGGGIRLANQQCRPGVGAARRRWPLSKPWALAARISSRQCFTFRHALSSSASISSKCRDRCGAATSLPTSPGGSRSPAPIRRSSAVVLRMRLCAGCWELLLLPFPGEVFLLCVLQHLVSSGSRLLRAGPAGVDEPLARTDRSYFWPMVGAGRAAGWTKERVSHL